MTYAERMRLTVQACICGEPVTFDGLARDPETGEQHLCDPDAFRRRNTELLLAMREAAVAPPDPWEEDVPPPEEEAARPEPVEAGEPPVYLRDEYAREMP